MRSAIMLCVGLCACEGMVGPVGRQGAPGTAGTTGVVVLEPEPPGTNCAVGGTVVRSGVDANANGTLEDSEVSSVAYVCDGAAPAEPAPPALVIGPHVYFTDGHAGALYFEDVTLAERASSLAWDVTGVSFGQQLTDRWAWTPDGASTTATLTVATSDPWTAAPLVSAQTLVSAAPAAAGTGTAPKCIFVGDSLTNAGAYTQALLDIASQDAMGIVLLGTRGAGANRHEGRGGWSIAKYTSDYADAYGANPFWGGGGVDFQSYLAANAIPSPDWVFILLGTNDVFSAGSDSAALAIAAAAFDRLEVLLESIRASDSAVRIALMTPPPPTSDQDLFASNYGSGQTRWRFKRNILLWNQELLARYGDQEERRVYVVPTHLAIDTAHDMANGVHPTTAGYQQIAESIWAFLKNQAR